jgi:transposase InsO family protein
MEFGQGNRSPGRRDGDEGVPEHLRSDNGPEFVTRDLRKWLTGTEAKTAYIEPGSPWENGYCEGFNSKLRNEFLNGEIFYSMRRSGCWRIAGAFTTTPTGHTPRWVKGHRRRR